jgi:putative ABC transport system permease protein
MMGLAQDLRYALRQLRKSPSFTAVAVLTLTLGIGANTAIFSVLNGMLLKMLPVREPAELVQLEETYHAQAFNFFSYPTYLRLRDTNQVFSNLFGWAIRGINAKFGGEVEPVVGMYVTGNYYAALGVPAVVGRMLLPEDDRANAAPVAVLSYNAWQKRFGASPNVIGQTIMLERVPVTVVGVTPSGSSAPRWAARSRWRFPYPCNRS